MTLKNSKIKRKIQTWSRRLLQKLEILLITIKSRQRLTWLKKKNHKPMMTKKNQASLD